MALPADEPACDTIVRRFTDSLDGATELERATITAQERHDAEEEREHDLRLRSYYEDTTYDSLALDFSAAEIARKALQAACKNMENEIKPSRLGKIGVLFGKQHKSAKAQANEAVQRYVASDFSELNLLVESQESQWKSTHGTIYRNFQRLCRNLDAHKRVFDIFPQENVYAKVLCGSLSLIVQASVNHEDIADALSTTVTEIAIESSYCAQLIDVIQTPAMREQLSKVYALMFRFYRDAIEWYLSSTRSKFFGSFNERIRKGFDDTAKAIKETINYMFSRSLPLGTGAMLKVMQRDVAFSKAEILRQRQNQWAQSGSHTDPGDFMQAFLRAMYQFQAVDGPESKRLSVQAEDRAIEDVPESKSATDRPAMRETARQLERYIVGDEGHSLFRTGEFWKPDPKVVAVLQNWMSTEESPRTLWVSGHTAPTTVTSARAAALNVVLAAWRVQAPIISHFCERPRHGADGSSSEESGTVGLVYSLITQLLQFNVDDDELDISLDDISRLNGSSASFALSLEILYQALIFTPHVRYCVIHDLNVLEWGGGAEWCHDLLDVLFRAQTNCKGTFKILLTTSGSSRVLAERIPARSQCFAEKSALQVPLPKSGRDNSEG